jgi:hypothetical protein
MDYFDVYMRLKMRVFFFLDSISLRIIKKELYQEPKNVCDDGNRLFFELFMLNSI